MIPFTLRPAREADFPAIRALIHQVQINPTGLDWRRFVVAVTPGDELIGCGQVKPHKHSVDAPVRELASIAVTPEWRGHGVARAIIEHLLTANPGSLYLTCRGVLGPFYEKFGFRKIGEAEMPPYFQRLSRIVKMIQRLHLLPGRMLVMRRD
jgi:N-acetylglutamate synthase-like GNAT family acetyltransferase